MRRAHLGGLRQANVRTSTSEWLFVLLALAIAAGACSTPRTKGAQVAASGAAPASGAFTPTELAAFAALNPIDTHTHIFKTRPAFVAMLNRLNLHVLDISLDDDHDPFLKDLPRVIRHDREFVEASHGRGAFCTTFDPFKFKEPGFTRAAIREINDDFNRGAVAVKIWKNIGMELKDARGRYVMPDNPVFEPIYEDIAAHNKTLIAHVADPNTLWEAPNPDAPDYSYYMHHPEWYMYRKSHPVSKAEILRARDHLLEENPHLRVVGAHLGSMESDFDQLARHLDRYPNFAVDLAARMPYLMMQPRARMIAFITRFQERLLYATDLDFMPGANTEAAVRNWENYYARDWRFLATNDVLEYHGRKVQGLNLPRPILRKLYHDNAVRWIPGIVTGKPSP